MVKMKPTPAEAGKGTKTVADYFTVIGKPDENKNEGKPLKNADIAVLLAKTNDNTKDNSMTMTMTTNTTTTTRPEEATTTGTYTAPADEEDKLGSGNTDIEVSVKSDKGQEEEEESDEVTVNADDQTLHFNGGTEEVINMGTDTVTTNEEKLKKDNKDVPEEQEGGKPKSNEMLVKEKKESSSLFGIGEIRKKNQKDRTNIINRVSMEVIKKDRKGIINESVEKDGMEISRITDLGATGITGKTETDSQNNNKKLSIEAEEATAMGADTEVIG